MCRRSRLERVVSRNAGYAGMRRTICGLQLDVVGDSRERHLVHSLEAPQEEDAGGSPEQSNILEDS
jgi:hypothetical protein